MGRAVLGCRARSLLYEQRRGSLNKLEHEVNGSVGLIVIFCLFCHYAQITVFTLKFTVNALLFAGLCFSCLTLKSSKVRLPLPHERTKNLP